ncbi:MAG: hypothetical protein NT007_02980 [Candidatus Kapabacteria bacterium]|nr:hypothetical protein [Candidatus Kapabacteria bacterium]
MKKNILKIFEMKIKGLFDTFLFAKPSNVSVIEQNQRIFSSLNISKILILRHDRIGDVLISIPLFKIIRNFMPDAEIDIILGKRNQEIQSSIKSYFNNIFVFDQTLFKAIILIIQLRRRKYDLIIDPFDKPSSTSSLIIKLSGIGNSLGFRTHSSVCTHQVVALDKNKYHIIERTAQLALAFGICPNSSNIIPEFIIDDEEKIRAQSRIGKFSKDTRVAIVLFGSSDSKFWGINNHIEFINKIKTQKSEIEFILFATKDHNDILHNIADQTGALAAPIANNIIEYAFLLYQCDMIFTPDTSAVHFATAWKKPVIALFPYDLGNNGMPWYPYKTPNRTLVAENGNIETINVNSVIEAFDSLFREIGC